MDTSFDRSLYPSDKKLIWANRIAFLVAGFGLAAWAPMIPFVKERFMLNENDLGLLLFCVAIGSFIAMPTSGFISSKLGCRIPIFLSSIGLAICLMFVTVIDNIYLMALNLVIFGVFAITLDVIANVNAALVEKVTNRNIMSGLHGLYSVGGFIGSLSVTFLLGNDIGLLLASIYAAVVVIGATILGCKSLFNTISIDSSTENVEVKKEKGSYFKYYTNPIVLLVGLMCFVMFMTEGSILDWSGVFLSQERGVAIENAGYGYAAFAVMMTICRLVGDKIVDIFGRRKIIILGTLCIISGFVLAVSVEHFVASFIGFALIGIGASNVVPQLVSLVSRVKEVPMHLSITIVNAIGFTGVLIGPALIGFLAQVITLPYTYLVQAVLVFMVTILSLIVLKPVKKTESTPESVEASKESTQDNIDFKAEKELC